ncbi:hypothetical protein Tco_1037274, partial [Tanacetum coccineum]
EIDSLNEFYGFMYVTDDDASISGKSSEFFGWDRPGKDLPGTKGDWQDDPYHETEDLFVELDQAIEDVVAEEIVNMANDQDEELFDQEVADDSLDDEEESGLKFWFRIQRFHNSGFGFVFQVSYSRFHIQRFRITHFVSRSFRIQRFRNLVVEVSDIGLLIIVLSYQIKSLFLKRSKLALYSLNCSNMSIANQQTLGESGAENRSLILEKGSYVPWASRFEGILNDIYKCVDAFKDAQTIWNKIKKIDASQFVPHVKASKAKKSARNHDPLVLVANLDAHSLYSHASSS